MVTNTQTNYHTPSHAPRINYFYLAAWIDYCVGGLAYTVYTCKSTRTRSHKTLSYSKVYYLVEVVISAWTASSIALATCGPPGSSGSLSSLVQLDTHLSRKENKERLQLLSLTAAGLGLAEWAPALLSEVVLDTAVQNFTKKLQACRIFMLK